MAERPIQFRLWNLLLVVACSALILGAARGAPARVLLVAGSVAVVLLAPAVLASLCLLHAPGATVAGVRLVRAVVGLPWSLRQRQFERRLARLRPGTSFRRVQKLLGSPARVDGFGDRTYWCYKVAGRRYAVSLDPRKLVTTYSY